MKKIHVILTSMIIVLVAGMSIAGGTDAEASESGTQKVYSPSILNAIADVIDDSSTRLIPVR